MADPTQVYKGGIPQGWYDDEMKGSGFGVSGEGENGGVPGKADASSPKVVNQGGPTPQKTYNKSASESFLMDSSYKTNMEVGRPGSGKTVNPDDISHADHNSASKSSY